MSKLFSCSGVGNREAEGHGCRRIVFLHIRARQHAAIRQVKHEGPSSGLSYSIGKLVRVSSLIARAGSIIHYLDALRILSFSFFQRSTNLGFEEETSCSVLLISQMSAKTMPRLCSPASIASHLNSRTNAISTA